MFDYPKVLIACPNHYFKEYAFAQWIEAVNNIDYPNKEVLVADNSNNMEFFDRWKDKVPMVHLEMNEGPNRRIALSMEYLRKHFINGDARWWFNLESDIIPDPSVLNVMLEYGKGCDWISHYYPDRTDPLNITNGFGCNIFSRKLMENESFSEAPEETTTDGWFWHGKVKNNFKYKMTEGWHLFGIQHLDG